MTSSVGPSIAEVAPDTYRINIPLPDALRRRAQDSVRRLLSRDAEEG